LLVELATWSLLVISTPFCSLLLLCLVERWRAVVGSLFPVVALSLPVMLVMSMGQEAKSTGDWRVYTSPRTKRLTNREQKGEKNCHQNSKQGWMLCSCWLLILGLPYRCNFNKHDLT
jgi:hypothetical protein